MREFMNATSEETLKTKACAVCGKRVRKCEYEIRKLDTDEKEGVPHLELLTTEHQETCLEEYIHEAQF